MLIVKLYPSFKAMQKADYSERTDADVVAYEDKRGYVHIIKHRHEQASSMIPRAQFDEMVQRYNGDGEVEL